MRLAAVVLAAALIGAGCGGQGKRYPSRETVIGPIGTGDRGVWVFEPAGKPKRLVIYFHGQGGPQEATPVNHRAWIDHLVAGGNAVIYPRYETSFVIDPLANAFAGVRTAVDRLGGADLPVLAIGYSRGGALALEYAAEAPANDVPVPNEVMSVFPASQGEQGQLVDLSPLRDDTGLTIFVGDRDTVVRADGAVFLLRRLENVGFPADRIRMRFVKSRGSFVADHFAPMRTDAAAKEAFWKPADRLLENIEQSHG
jgi:pimeloyl-ACP methyl ester carboxylesterase